MHCGATFQKKKTISHYVKPSQTSIANPMHCGTGGNFSKNQISNYVKSLTISIHLLRQLFKILPISNISISYHRLHITNVHLFKNQISSCASCPFTLSLHTKQKVLFKIQITKLSIHYFCCNNLPIIIFHSEKADQVCTL